MSPATGGGEAGSAHAAGAASRQPAADVRTFVDAMRVAATASPDMRSHADRIAALERFVALSPSGRRAHVAALSEAALEAEARWRTSIGLPPMGTRLFAGWIDLPSPAAVDGDGAVGEGTDAPDLDGTIALPTTVERELLDVTGASEEVERRLNRLEAAAFAPCFGTSASCLGGGRRRRTLLVLWSALRRGRPLAAAVLRRCLALDRAWRARAGAGP